MKSSGPCLFIEHFDSVSFGHPHMKFDGETELPKFGVFRRRYQATMFFCSHTWRSVKGLQKVLALILQLGWLHGLIGSFVDMTAMCFLQEIKILPDPDSANYIVAGRTVPRKTNPWVLVVTQVSLVVGLWSSTYLPCRRKMCFPGVACIHQGDQDLFERGIYGIGGCLSVTKELRILYSPDYLSSLWCIFES